MINVNLLPPDIKSEISQSKRNKEIRSLVWKVALVLLFVSAISVLTLLYFYSEKQSASGEFDEKTKAIKAFGNIEEKSKNLSDRINSVKMITAETNKWSGVIEELQKIIPSGIYLSSLRIDSTQNNRNQISGFAKSKNEVATLRDEMEKSSKFQYVDIESSTTSFDQTKKIDVETFTLSFSLEKGVLK